MSRLAEGLSRYLSASQLRRLAEVTIGIAGSGGLGSNVAMLLTRSGCKRFVLVDGDVVESSNLNRQFFWPEDIGKAKAKALRDRLLSLEPGLDCQFFVEWLRPETAGAIFAGCDVVVEALDEASLKAGLCSSLIRAGHFVVAASGIGGCGLPPMKVRRLGSGLICVGDFSSAVGDSTPPLAPRVMQAAALQAEAALSKILETDPIL